MPAKYQTNPSDATHLHELLEYIKAHLKDWYGDNAKVLSEQPEVRAYPSSFFLCYAISDSENSTKNLLIKIRRRPYMTTISQTTTIEHLHKNMPTEYDSLKTIYENTSSMNKSIEAVRPLGYFQSLNAIIMEEKSAVTLGKMLLEMGKTIIGKDRKFKPILDVARKTGEWTYFFHHVVHKAGEIRFSSDKFMEDITELTSHINAKNGYISIRVANLFSTAANKFENLPLYLSITHGDLTIDNILYKDGRVCSIDIKSKPAPTYSDLGLILIHPETIIPQIISLGQFIPKAYIQKYQEAILDGYFGNAKKDLAIIYLYCALQVLDKWVMYEDIFSSRRNFKKLIANLLSPLFKMYFLHKIKSYLVKSEAQ